MARTFSIRSSRVRESSHWTGVLRYRCPDHQRDQQKNRRGERADPGISGSSHDDRGGGHGQEDEGQKAGQTVRENRGQGAAGISAQAGHVVNTIGVAADVGGQKDVEKTPDQVGGEEPPQGQGHAVGPEQNVPFEGTQKSCWRKTARTPGTDKRDSHGPGSARCGPRACGGRPAR